MFSTSRGYSKRLLLPDQDTNLFLYNESHYYPLHYQPINKFI